jgi:molybdate transport system substrate-binding protein
MTEHTIASPVLKILTLLIIAAFGALGPLVLSSSAAEPASGQLTIAAAADLKFALDKVIIAFQKTRPAIKVQASYGSSGNFFAQIVNQAPFDLFLSADVSSPHKLMEQGLAVTNSEFIYAQGKVVVWVPNSSPLHSIPLDAKVLSSAALLHLAVANPQHAPYGRAAVAALKGLGWYEAVAPKLVFGENVAQAFQFAQSGMAEAGLIALSLALAPEAQGTGRYWEIPETYYPRMDQGGIILKHSGNLQSAWSFRQFLLSEEGKNILKKYGFNLPGE